MANIEHLLDDIRKDKYCQEMRETFCNALIETNKAAEEMESTVKKIVKNCIFFVGKSAIFDIFLDEWVPGVRISIIQAYMVDCKFLKKGIVKV